MTYNTQLRRFEIRTTDFRPIGFRFADMVWFTDRIAVARRYVAFADERAKQAIADADLLAETLQYGEDCKTEQAITNWSRLMGKRWRHNA